MKVCFVLFMLCLTASAFKKKILTSRISGGKPASLRQFPWHALVVTHCYYLEKTGFITICTSKCGGALISPNWILTAAHCIAEKRILKVIKVDVELGMVYRYDKYKTRLVAKNYILHPNFDRITLQNDIALIELPRNVTFTNNISFIPIISKQVPNDKKLIVSGFGKTENGPESDNLLYVDVKVDRNECAKQFSYILPEKIICCRGEGIKDVCEGDSGGPLIAYEKGQPFLVGIASGGAECGSGKPRVYSSALAYRPWIKQISKI